MTLRAIAAFTLISFLPAAQLPPPPEVDPRHRAFDALLDVNVRDGLVYYRAMEGQRAALSRYVASLDVTPAAFTAMTRPEQMALLINAYNAIVLQTVIQNYPIQARVSTAPAKSIRQIPAVNTKKHRVAGRAVSLDEIERWLIDEYKDARVIFALGRGALGSGRLKSEAYTASRLDAQLEDATREFVTRQGHFRIDRGAKTIVLSPLYSWREKDLVAGFESKAEPVFSARGPVEKAILAVTLGHLFPSEQAFLRENGFKMTFGEFDWRLNDLTGGRID
ncbi:MAG: DUF547 domain-containing protein [Acidobacteriota bacterium]|nr:DUF547 domain-containing protein [Acidobacteriota bacterium]